MGTSFTGEIDIINRALQHCGVARIASLTEDTLQAQETVFCYDKLRRAELRRNQWAFATRKVAIRAVETGTMLLVPSAYNQFKDYGFGDICIDSSGIIWQSRAQDNTGNTPGSSTQWEVYCGPMTVTPYDTTGATAYWAGELVYETPGDGTYTIYLSLASGNSQDPRSPTLYDPDVQYSKDDVVVYYATWAIGTTYSQGNVVAYNDNYYISLVNSNLGLEPDTNSASWALISLTSAPPYYSSLTTYSQGQMVTSGGVNYISLQSNNTGNTPASSASYWLAQQAGTFYVSKVDLNVNNTPPSSASQWTSTDNFGQASDQWWTITATLTDLLIVYPIGSGPSHDATTKNCYRLPANFLRKADQDPKAGSASFLGAPTGSQYDDWVMEGDYIISQRPFPILLRFIADVQDVTKYDDMFCEMLALRIGLSVVDRLTQSPAKKQSIELLYKLHGTEARTVNAIEIGSEEAPVDDWISCRL